MRTKSFKQEQEHQKAEEVLLQSESFTGMAGGSGRKAKSIKARFSLSLSPQVPTYKAGLDDYQRIREHSV